MKREAYRIFPKMAKDMSKGNRSIIMYETNGPCSEVRTMLTLGAIRSTLYHHEEQPTIGFFTTKTDSHSKCIVYITNRVSDTKDLTKFALPVFEHVQNQQKE